MFKRLSIRYKIALIALIGFVGFSIYQTANYRLSLEIRDRLASLVSEEFPILKFANYSQVSFTELDKLFQAALAEADLDTLAEAEDTARILVNEFSLIENTQKVSSDSFQELHRLLLLYVEKTSVHTRLVLEKKITYDQVIKGYSDIGIVRDAYVATHKQFLDERYQSFLQSLLLIEKDEQFIVEFGLILGLILTLVLGLVSIVIIQRIISAFSLAVNFAQSIAEGKLDVSFQSDAQDETGQLIKSLNAMRQVLKAQTEESTLRSSEQNFLAGLNEALRGDPNIKQLSQKVCEYTLEQMPQTAIAAMYFYEESFIHRETVACNVKEDDEARFEQVQSLMQALPDVLEMGEQRIGVAATQSSITTTLSDVDDELSGQFFSHWLYFPITLDHKFKAILVLNSVDIFPSAFIDLLNRSNRVISMSIHSAQARLKVASMLEQTQQQAKELQKKRFELALTNDQLEDQKRDLDEQKNRILEKNHELEISQQALVEKSEALEQSGKYKSQFLSTMSHELRTPLNSILLLSESLLENKAGNLTAKQQRHAEIINSAGDELLSLINDILDLSKVEEGKMEVVYDRLPLIDLSKQLERQFEIQAQKGSLKFSVQLESTAPEMVFTDKFRLYQVLKNFISNAFKFTEQGEITVRISQADTLVLSEYLPHLDQEQSFLLLEINDTGVGIAEDKQSLIFEAFKQVDGTTSRKYGGTGLGLTISTELAKLLGGDIFLRSEGIGHGSTFALCIPFGDESLLRQDEVNAGDWKEEYADLLNVQEPLSILNAHPLPSVLPYEEVLILCSEDQSSIVDELMHSIPLPVQCISSVDALNAYVEKQLPELLVVDETFEDQVNELTCLDERLKWLVSPVDASCLKLVLQKKLQGQVGDVAKVLFIEDNPVFHEVIRSVFNRRGLACDIVSTGAQALDALYKHTYDLLVVDLNLPDYSGLEICKAIRQISHARDKHMVIFTAEDLGAQSQQDFLSVVDEVYFKSPTVINELVNLAEGILQRKMSRPYHVLNQYQKAMQLSSVSSLSSVALHSGGEAESQSTLPLQGKKVILVDDDDRNLYSLGSSLEDEGVVIYQAQSGIEALHILEADTSIDLILLDIMMPEMDGYEVLAQIRHDPQWAFLPVFALTAKAMLGDEQKCLDAGASEYIAKPVQFSQLLEKMTLYLAK